MSTLSIQEVKSTFGDFSFTKSTVQAGKVIIDPKWVASNIVNISPPFPLRTANGKQVLNIHCHIKVAPQLLGALRYIQEQGLTSLISTYDGCFVPRYMNWKPGRALSRHSWGIAIDLNARQYPYTSSLKQDRRLIRIFDNFGFMNGEIWNTPDPMHFECYKVLHSTVIPYKLIFNDHLVQGDNYVIDGKPVGQVDTLLQDLNVPYTIRIRPDQNKIYVYTRRLP